ncbi:hypothetical protein K438DRAFT_1783569 [Mycena galopus ATCC 62051]|nr:hypothetical protein K438DRAFT_1783569 [Mycena galopus ATCC 62051]
MIDVVRKNSYEECHFLQRDFLLACKSQVHCFADYIALRDVRDARLACTKAIWSYRSARYAPWRLQTLHGLAPPPPPAPAPPRQPQTPVWGWGSSQWGSMNWVENSDEVWGLCWGSGWAPRVQWTDELVPRTPGKRKHQRKCKAARRAMEMERVAAAWAEDCCQNEVEWARKEVNDLQKLPLLPLVFVLLVRRHKLGIRPVLARLGPQLGNFAIRLAHHLPITISALRFPVSLPLFIRGGRTQPSHSLPRFFVVFLKTAETESYLTQVISHSFDFGQRYKPLWTGRIQHEKSRRPPTTSISSIGKAECWNVKSFHLLVSSVPASERLLYSFYKWFQPDIMHGCFAKYNIALRMLTTDSSVFRFWPHNTAKAPVEVIPDKGIPRFHTYDGCGVPRAQKEDGFDGELSGSKWETILGAQALQNPMPTLRKYAKPEGQLRTLIRVRVANAPLILVYFLRTLDPEFETRHHIPSSIRTARARITQSPRDGHPSRIPDENQAARITESASHRAGYPPATTSAATRPNAHDIGVEIQAKLGNGCANVGADFATLSRKRDICHSVVTDSVKPHQNQRKSNFRDAKHLWGVSGILGKKSTSSHLSRVEVTWIDFRVKPSQWQRLDLTGSSRLREVDLADLSLSRGNIRTYHSEAADDSQPVLNIGLSLGQGVHAFGNLIPRDMQVGKSETVEAPIQSLDAAQAADFASRPASIPGLVVAGTVASASNTTQDGRQVRIRTGLVQEGSGPSTPQDMFWADDLATNLARESDSFSYVLSNDTLAALPGNSVDSGITVVMKKGRNRNAVSLTGKNRPPGHPAIIMKIPLDTFRKFWAFGTCKGTPGLL